MANKIKVGIAQYSMKIGHKEENEEKALNVVTQLAQNDNQIILLPELFSTEYFPAERNMEYFSYANQEDDPIIKQFQSIAKKLRVSILLPYFEKAGLGIYYNTTLYLNNSGEIGGRYRKVHIPAVRSIEKYYFRPGNELPIFTAEWGKFGCLTCQDRLYPEAFRVLALKGAQVIFVSNASGDYANFSEMWSPMHRTRAYENGCFIVTSNRVGKENDINFFGNSLIADPTGKILSIASDQEENIEVDLNLDEVEQMRNLLQMYRDFRSEVYQEICSFK